MTKVSCDDARGQSNVAAGPRELERVLEQIGET
jgi:hypothetical protein